MVDCDVIQDLIEVTLSGEASEATRQMVEAHLEECADCREMFDKARQAEEALAVLKTDEKPANGRAFMAQLKRWVFGIGTGLLLLGSLVLAFATHLPAQVFGLPYPQVFPFIPLWVGGMAAAVYAGGLVMTRRAQSFEGKQPWMWLRISALAVVALVVLGAMSRSMAIGASSWLFVLLALYIYLIRWRSWQSDLELKQERLLSIESGALFLLFGLALLTHEWIALAPAALVLAVAAAYTFRRVGNLRYMSQTAAVVLVVVMLTQIVVPSVMMLDALDMYPAAAGSLGHPVSMANASAATSFRQLEEGLNFTGVGEVGDELFGLPLEGVESAQALYVLERNEAVLEARITVFRFEDAGAALAFVDEMHTAIIVNFSGVSHDVDYRSGDMSMPFFETNLLRMYETRLQTAYNFWPSGEWVTLIEVEGPFFEALDAARDIRVLVSEGYGE